MVDMQVKLVTSRNQEITNMAYINPKDLEVYQEIEQDLLPRCCAACFKRGFALINGNFVVRLRADETLGNNEIALNKKHCEYLKTWRGCVVTVEKFELPSDIEMVALYVELQMTSGHPSQIDARTLEERLKKSFNGQIMHVGQRVQFIYKGFTGIYTVNRVIMGGNEGVSKSGIKGMLSGKTKIFFDPLTENLTICNQTMVPGRIFRRDINPKEAEYKLKALGVGGMGKIFSDLCTKVFATRTMDPNLSERLGITHVKGILLYGPPGTGKILFMRALSKVLYAREPKVVNGPRLLSNWDGESEEIIRKLFNDACEDYGKYGENSPLHMIIFDEIDSIAQRRGKVCSKSQSDKFVSQLLTVIDDVNILKNILIVGTTNNKDVIDEALLRPDRLGIHIEVGLPDYEGRLNILEVHTEKMNQCLMLESNVDLGKIAFMTDGCSGAELESITNNALCNALSRIKPDGLGHVDERQIKVNEADFDYGIQVVRLAR